VAASGSKGAGQDVDGGAVAADKILGGHVVAGGVMAAAGRGGAGGGGSGKGRDKLSSVSPCVMPTGKQQQQKRI
jgi:hypothetical protein